MAVRVMSNRKGMSLISVLVAMLIFLVVMLGLLSGIIYSRHLSTRNLLRNEATRIVQETFDEYRNDNQTKINDDFVNISSGVSCADCLDNSSLSSSNGCHVITRQINNNENVKFAMLFEGTQTNDSTGIYLNMDNITICWRYLNVLYERKFSTVILK